MRAKAQKHPRTRSDVNKETPRMPKRLASLFALAVTATALLGALFAGSASAAPLPWWQVLDGSRPTHMWEASDNVQEVTTELVALGEEEVLVSQIELGGELIGCLGSENPPGAGLCEFFIKRPLPSTAPQLEALL